MERVSQPFVGPYSLRHGQGDMTLVEPSDPPQAHDEVLVESRVRRHAPASRKRSEGDELPGAVGAVLLVLVVAVTCHAPCAGSAAKQRGNKIAP